MYTGAALQSFVKTNKHSVTSRFDIVIYARVKIYTVELQWVKHLWYHESMFETGVVRADEVNNSARSGGIIGIFFFRFSSA